MAGTKPEPYQQQLAIMNGCWTYADQAGYSGSGHPEDHRIEASRSPTIHCSCPCGSANTRNVYASSPAGSSRPRIIRCERRRASPQWTTCWAGASGSASFADIKRAGSTTSVFARTCKRSALGTRTRTGHLQLRLFRRIRRDRGQGVDARNILPPRKILTFLPEGFVNLHPHSVYADYGRVLLKICVSVRLASCPSSCRRSLHPQLYGGFTASMTTAKFWAQYAGRPIVLAEDLNFCETIWFVYRDEAAKHSYNIALGDEAGWAVL